MCPIKGSNSSSEVAADAGPPTRAKFAVAELEVVLDGGLMVAPGRELLTVAARGGIQKGNDHNVVCETKG